MKKLPPLMKFQEPTNLHSKMNKDYLGAGMTEAQAPAGIKNRDFTLTSRSISSQAHGRATDRALVPRDNVLAGFFISGNKLNLSNYANEYNS